MTWVKICGLRELEHGKVALEEGAALLGFVFAPSRRRVEPDIARNLVAALRPEGSFAAVGVFVDETVETMNHLAEYCDLDYIQLSGDEPDEVVRHLARPVIRTIHVGGDGDRIHDRLASAPGEIILLDTAVAGARGGTGEAFDWSGLPPLERPVLLAGGLHPGNVAEAIGTVHPWGVDVSSGVETAGRKDAAKIRAFIAAAQSVHLPRCG